MAKNTPAPKSPKYWVVKSSGIHNRGIFAKLDIPFDVPILEYTGEKITKAESQRRGQALMERAAKSGGAAVYIFSLNQKYDLDGGGPGNVARLMNHSCDPNCEAFIIRGKIWLFSKKAIKAGEELSFNYGFEIDTWEDHPCRCGSANCVGYIVNQDDWDELKKRIKEKQRLEA
jgi:hypothetical protein